MSAAFPTHMRLRKENFNAFHFFLEFVLNLIDNQHALAAVLMMLAHHGNSNANEAQSLEGSN